MGVNTLWKVLVRYLAVHELTGRVATVFESVVVDSMSLLMLIRGLFWLVCGLIYWEQKSSTTIAGFWSGATCST